MRIIGHGSTNSMTEVTWALRNGGVPTTPKAACTYHIDNKPIDPALDKPIDPGALHSSCLAKLTTNHS